MSDPNPTPEQRTADLLTFLEDCGFQDFNDVGLRRLRKEFEEAEQAAALRMRDRCASTAETLVSNDDNHFGVCGITGDRARQIATALRALEVP